MDDHSLNSDSCAVDRQMGETETETPARADMCASGLSTERQRGAAWARSHVERALKIAGVSDAVVGERLGISKTRAEHLRTGRGPYHLGDVSRFPRNVAIPLLRAMLAELEASVPASSLPLSRRTLRIGMHTGELQRVVEEATADGVVDAHERVTIARASRAVATEATYLERETLVPEGPR